MDGMGTVWGETVRPLLWEDQATNFSWESRVMEASRSEETGER